MGGRATRRRCRVHTNDSGPVIVPACSRLEISVAWPWNSSGPDRAGTNALGRRWKQHDKLVREIKDRRRAEPLALDVLDAGQVRVGLAPARRGRARPGATGPP